MLLFDVQRASERPMRSYPWSDRWIERSERSVVAAFATLTALLAVRLLAGGGPMDALVLAIAGVVAGGWLVHRAFVTGRTAQRRAEAESVARLLRGLSRSVSPDAIVSAIASELAQAAEADHVVVVRRRDDPARLEATLVSARPGIPSSTTMLPAADLDDDRSPRPGRDRLRVVDGGRARAMAVGSTPAALASHGATAGHGASTGHGVSTGQSASEAAASQMAVPMAIADRIAARVGGLYGLRSLLAAPLVADGRVLGALILSRRTSSAWAPAARRLLDDAAAEASIALARATSQRAAETQASTDALTGLPNRRYFDEFVGLLARRRRSGDAVGILMVDIDRFKRLNDSRGHATGDEVLRAVAWAIASAVREDDVPARYGGEEFAVLLRNPSRAVAVEVGERVRAAVGRLDLSAHRVPSVTVSVGVAVQDGPEQPVAALIELADQALYRAKRAGRDRVVAA